MVKIFFFQLLNRTTTKCGLVFQACMNRPFPNYAPLLTNKTFKLRLSANFSYICCTFSTWPRLDVSVCQQWSVIRKWPISATLLY